MRNSSTHPANAFGNEDAISLQDFNRVIHSACDNEYRSRAKMQPYREVRVLCFHFETDQFGVGTYCDKIKNVFSQGFGFRVATSTLPGTTFAQRDMLTALEEAFDGMDSECLVIIYYIDRGEVRHQLRDAQL
ncbi:uncharacterized protein FIESC28_00153 [Fusarium coffeatum]|uniref:Uncharacterized protein n=1 Tax=Fusarium coffeatum TaxID=231269 RepID=A0A366SCN2_9HYPO|nr:uncharacterized protein FIESC28_00153 [Fusarium coffeatum]RBR27081.1 hypothetical protein FIESC28_00153 [Fusarium coffeatum]